MTVLIVGGIWQGKRDYAKTHFGISSDEIISPDQPIGSDAKCIDQLQDRIWDILKKGTCEQQIKWIDDLLCQCTGKICICDDISCGIVPLEEEQRVWREMVGRFLCRLAQKADLVVRIQCGIGQIIKGEENENDCIDPSWKNSRKS